MTDNLQEQAATADEVARLREAVTALTARDADSRQRAERLELTVELLQMQVTVLRQDTERDFEGLGAAVSQLNRRTR